MVKAIDCEILPLVFALYGILLIWSVSLGLVQDVGLAAGIGLVATGQAGDHWNERGRENGNVSGNGESGRESVNVSGKENGRGWEEGLHHQEGKRVFLSITT